MRSSPILPLIPVMVLVLVVGGCPTDSTSATGGGDDEQTAQESPTVVEGATGAQGEQGEEGPRGLQGATGATGSEGPTGVGLSFIVDAGGAQSAYPGDEVVLDGSGTYMQESSEYDISEVTWRWKQVDDSDTRVTILDADKSRARFTVAETPDTCMLEFRLTVTDPDGVAGADDAIVFVPSLETPVFTAPQVGGAARLTTYEGELEISLSVQDVFGNLIEDGLDVSNFEFRNVRLIPVGGGLSHYVNNPAVVRVTVHLPEAAALTAVLDFDCSGSMAWNDPDGTGRQAGGLALISQMDPEDDEAAVLAFPGDDGLYHASRVLQDFTSDQTDLRAALELLDADGGTPLWDSAMDALAMLDEHIVLGGVVVLMTDGGDTLSTHDADDVIETATNQFSRVCTIGMGSEVDFSELQRVAVETEGAFAEASNNEELQAAFEQIATALGVGYVTIEGRLIYPGRDPGQYVVRGELITNSGCRAVITSFPADG